MKLKRVVLVFCVLIGTLIPIISIGQIVLLDTFTNSKYYEKVLLDGKLAYRNIRTKTIHRTTNSSIKTKNIINNSIVYNTYWDTTCVNPYKEVKIEYPFSIDFTDKNYTLPVDGKMVITSRFGRRRRGPHRGIDIDLVTGDKVYAMLPGIVRYVGYGRGHGKTVIIRHDNNLETIYAHLSNYNVAINDYVNQGDYIGKGGRTGNARGSHLHLETRYNGVRIHPEYIFDFSNVEHELLPETLWVTESLCSPKYHNSRKKSKLKALDSQETAITYEESIPRIYVIRKGDTLGGIARRQNSTVREICKMNGIRSTSTLRIGQRLKIR